MKIYRLAAAAALLASMTLLPSCEEFDPVFTGKYPLPESWEEVEMTPTKTIKELCELYNQGSPLTLEEDIVIGGKVCTSDQVGNFYRSFYIQDGTAGIEIKMGKTGLYNEYKIGQTVYVKCKGLTLGMYGFSSSSSYGGQGMVQLGCVDPSGEYETSYIEVQSIIDEHIFRGAEGTPDEPIVLEENQLPGKNDNQTSNEFIGRLVTIKNLRYANEVFALLYINPNLEHKDSKNRVFLSDGTFGITTWAMSEQNVKAHLRAGLIQKECALLFIAQGKNDIIARLDKTKCRSGIIVDRTTFALPKTDFGNLHSRVSGSPMVTNQAWNVNWIRRVTRRIPSRCHGAIL